MGNVERRKNYTDNSGKMFIPMSVEGSTWEEHFITTPKMVVIIGIVLAFIVIVISLSSRDGGATIATYLVRLGLWGWISSILLRYIVFEEVFYRKVYADRKRYSLSTPAIFWDIASIKDTEDGAIMTYKDARVAILVRIDRDTITGKPDNFMDMHYDAISDFYKDAVNNKYSFVQMNVMEQAGKDPRLSELSKLITKSDNPNICKLMEMEVGHIKTITYSNLYESDYILFYSRDISKVDRIFEDITRSLGKLMVGAYTGYEVLDSKGIINIMKELYGVSYFNLTEAGLNGYENEETLGIKPFTISGLEWSDGNVQHLNNSEVNRLRILTSEKSSGSGEGKKISLKKTLYKVDSEKNKIKFEDLSSGGHVDNVEDEYIDF